MQKTRKGFFFFNIGAPFPYVFIKRKTRLFNKYMGGGGRMRNLLLAAMIVTIIAGIRLNAHTVVTETGTLDDEGFALGGTEIIEGTVAWNQPGRYPVTFRDRETGTVDTGEVVITDSGDLTTGYDIEKTYGRISIEDDFESFSVLFVSADEYYVYGAIYRDHYPYSPKYNEAFMYVAYYDDHSLMWENIMYPDRYGSFTAACLLPGGIALIGDYDSAGSGRNAVICHFNNKGGLTYRREIHGSGNDFGHAIFYDDGALLFVLSANSRDGDYKFRFATDYDIVCGYWQPDEDEIRLRAFGNSGDDTFGGAAMAAGTLCVSVGFAGAGTFEYAGLTRFSGLIAITPELELKGFAPYEGTELPVYGAVGNFFVTRTHYTKPYIDYCRYDDALKIAITDKLELPDGMVVSDLMIRARDHDVAIYAVGAVGGQDRLYLALTGTTLNRKFDKTIPISDSPYIIGLHITEAGEIIHASLSGDKKVLRISGLIRIKRMTHVTDLERIVIENDDVTFNGRPASSRLTVTDVTSGILAPFGIYVNIERFSAPGYDVYLPVKLIYRPYFNVKSGATYDVGYTLFFNGDGYLNGKPIRIGHAVTEPGNYILEIVGAGGERSSVFFSVAYLSECDNEWSGVNPPSPLTFSYVPTPKGAIAAPTVHFSKRTVAEKSRSGGVFLLLSALIIGALAGGFVPAGKRGIGHV